MILKVVCVGHLENTGSVSFEDLPHNDSFLTQYKTITFINITVDIIRNIFKEFQSCQVYGGNYNFSEILIFPQKLCISSLATNTVISLKWQAHFVYF